MLWVEFAPPPPFTKDKPSLRGRSMGWRVFFFPLFLKGVRLFHIVPKHLTTAPIFPILQPFFLCSGPDSLLSPDQVQSSSEKLPP